MRHARGDFRNFDGDSVGAGSRTRLSIDLDRNVGLGGWALQANYFDETTNTLRVAASAFFAAADPTSRNNRIDFEWTAGSPGHLTMWRTRFVNGVPDASGRVLMFSVDLPGMQNAAINHVLAGMVSGQDPGTFGSLYLDELSFRR